MKTAGSRLGLLWSFSGCLKASRAAPGVSAAQGTTGVAYLYVGVYTCIMLACFQLGSWGRPKRKSDHRPVSHLKADFFSTSLTKSVISFPSWIFLSHSLVGERMVIEWNSKFPVFSLMWVNCG